MQVLIDNIAAVVVGAVVLLILFALQFRGEEAAIDSVQYNAAKQEALNMAQVMEQDFSNIGSGLTTAQIDGGQAIDADTNFVNVTASNPGRIEFRARTDPGDPAVHTIRYEWSLTGKTVQVKDPATNTYVGTPTYELKRTVDGAPAGQARALTAFDVRLRREDGSDITTLNNSTQTDARQVRVSLRAVSPLGGGTTAANGGMEQNIDQTRWNRVFRPVNLTR